MLSQQGEYLVFLKIMYHDLKKNKKNYISDWNQNFSQGGNHFVQENTFVSGLEVKGDIQLAHQQESRQQKRALNPCALDMSEIFERGKALNREKG